MWYRRLIHNFLFSSKAPNYHILVFRMISDYKTGDIFRHMMYHLRSSGKYATIIPVELSERKEYSKIKNRMKYFNEAARQLLEENSVQENITTVSSADAILSQFTETLSTEDSLKLLDAFLFVTQNGIKRLKFYENWESLIRQQVRCGHDYGPFLIIQILFFLSLGGSANRETGIYLFWMMERYINSFEILSLDDIVILSASSYRLSVKLHSEDLKTLIVNRLLSNITNALTTKNMVYFTCLIKALNASYYHNIEFLDEISRNIKILEFIPNASIISKVHLLSLYADSSYPDIDFLSHFIRPMVNVILDDKCQEEIRGKDLAILLWTASFLRVNIPNADMLKNKTIEIFNEDMLYTLEKKFQKYVITMLLAMWILNWNPTKLIQKLITNETNEFTFKHAHMKYEQRFRLLCTCLSIEAPDLLPSSKHMLSKNNLCHLSLRDNMRKRDFLRKVYNAICCLKLNLQLGDIQHVYNIPNMWICAISVVNRRSELVYVEVLDDFNCLKNTNIPDGIMTLKLRLLDRLGYKYFLMDYKKKAYNQDENLFKDIEKHLMSK